MASMTVLRLEDDEPLELELEELELEEITLAPVLPNVALQLPPSQ